MTDGALLIDKPEGLTSFGVVHHVKRALSERYQVPIRKLPKVGHGGTLDPFATGLLVIFIGRGSKLAQYFLQSPKTYEATIRFGATTSSGDLTDPITETTTVLPANLDSVIEAGDGFVRAPYLQTPPMHSAQKMNGQRLYTLAHQGLSIERVAKERRIYSIRFETQNRDAAIEECKMTVTCSSGTYVRVLAQDIAKELGSLGYLTTLRRTGSGAQTLEAAAPLVQTTEALKKGAHLERLPNFVPFDSLLRTGFARLEVQESDARALMQGRPYAAQAIVTRAGLLSVNEGDYCIALYCRDSLIGTLIRETLTSPWRLDRIFLRSEGQTPDTPAP